MMDETQMSLSNRWLISSPSRFKQSLGNHFVTFSTGFITRNGRSISSSVVVQSIDVSKHKYIRHYYSCSVIISDLVMSSAIPSKWKVNVAYNTMSKLCGSIIKNDSQNNNSVYVGSIYFPILISKSYLIVLDLNQIVITNHHMFIRK